MDVRTELRSYLETTTKPDGSPISQSDIANAIGKSPTTISQYLQGKYGGDNKALEDDIREFLQREQERRVQPKLIVPFVTTSVASRVKQACRIAHLDSDIAVVCGAAGLGKTAALKDYAKKNSGVILIEAHLGYTARVLFQELHKLVGYDGTPGNINKLFSDVVERLKGSDRLIIIDESEHLPYKALELIRRIHDKAEVGIVLCGMPRLVSNLRGKKGEYAQLYSRVGVSAQLESLSLTDVQKLMEKAMPDAAHLATLFHDITKGNARLLLKLIQRTKRTMQVNSLRKVNEDVVRTAMQSLII